jgi:predicted nucleotidyltransferase
MTVNGVHFPLEQIAGVCRKYGACQLSLFGSILGLDFRPDSDIDLLVSFSPGTRISLLGIANMEADLSAILGRPVDLRSPEDLSKYFRHEVTRRAQWLHAA